VLTGERTTPTAPARRRIRIPPLLPARLRRVRRPRLWEEVVFIGVSYFIYSLIRNGVPSHETAAFHRADDLLVIERQMHINFELAVNKAVASVDWLVQSANYYYATMHFAVTIGVLVWLYLRHPLQYRSVRSVLYATNIVALIGFWVYPLAPPRMLPGDGYIDTVVAFHTWGSWGSGGVDAASNQFAAMPSLHIGWALWCGIAMVRLSRRTWVKVAGALYPVGTFLVIVATANHYVLDAVGGVAVLAIGFAVQRLLSGRPAFADPRAVPAVVSLRD
jgi:hypothetical protein